ncbi:hypothetical protein GCM10009639_55270 [Kitasatospora putterlickiae]|uniref:Uncharacterized protein n=1 Tax=Kitasatospora putterlickiae TaxID=221725 RepID=A0ABP4J6A3_9ACTN
MRVVLAAVLRVRGRRCGPESGVVGIVVVVEQPQDPALPVAHATGSAPDVRPGGAGTHHRP